MVKGPSNLILPEYLIENTKKTLVKGFKDNLEKRINENQSRDEPYFIAYHETDDRVTGEVNNCWTVSSKMPRFMARQIVYWVDNKKGFKEWLWTINDDRKPFFNIEGVRKAKKEGAIAPRKR